MSKQVLTPRFYVDMPSFLHATGREWAREESTGGAELLYMNPSNPFITKSDSSVFFKVGGGQNNSDLTSFPINFVALLNHNLASDDNYFMVQAKRQIFEDNQHGGMDWETLTGTADYNCTSILNAQQGYSNNLNPTYNGSTIFSIDDGNGNPINDIWESFFVKYNDGFDETLNHQLGSFVVGKYWDAPNSPDLNLTMSRRFEGIKKQKTIGGKTLPSIYYDGPIEWKMNGPDGIYKYPAFELDLPDSIPDLELDGNGDPTNEVELKSAFNKRAKSGLGRKGLRSWDLTFSYISEDDMWMDNEVSSKLISDDVIDDDSGSADPNPMLSDDSFNFVWNCTLGGTLPFIFQPDNTNNNPDQFAICTFRDNTLKVKRVAYNTYSLSITIDEVT